jgi:hypothetical protein
MTAPDDATVLPPSPDEPKVGLWEDFIDIFTSPSDVFERRRDSGFIVPLLIYTVLMVVVSYIGIPALRDVFNAEFTRSTGVVLRQNPQVTSEQLAKARELSQKLQMITIAGYSFFAPMLVGLVLWIVGKFVDATESLKAACMVATYAFFPRIIEGIINIVQGYTLDPSVLNGRYRLTLGVGRFLDPDVASHLLLAVVGRIDLFTIWVTILLAIGLRVVGRVSKTQAAIAAVIMWIIGLLPGLFPALMGF